MRHGFPCRISDLLFSNDCRLFFIQQIKHLIGDIGDYAVGADIAQALDFIDIVYGPVLNRDAEIVTVSYESFGP